MDDQDSLWSLRKGILNRKGIPIEVAKGLAKKFKLKSPFQTNLLSRNRLPEEFFRKHSQQSHLFVWFLNGYHRPIYM